MDFIEKLFGVSPDGGSGTLEFLLLVVPLMAAVAIVTLARRRRIH
jgi:hypothetical protein